MEGRKRGLSLGLVFGIGIGIGIWIGGWVGFCAYGRICGCVGVCVCLFVDE